VPFNIAFLAFFTANISPRLGRFWALGGGLFVEILCPPALLAGFFPEYAKTGGGNRHEGCYGIYYTPQKTKSQRYAQKNFSRDVAKF